MTKPVITVEHHIKPHWNKQGADNAKAVIEFIQLLMNDHNFSEISKRYANSPYKQHNRNMADTISGVVKTVSDFVKGAPEFSYDVKHVFVDGEHVIVHSHATLKAKHRGDDTQGFNIIDTWKLKDGKLIEHWDAVQGLSFSMRLYSLLAGGKIKNTNGVF